MTKIFLRSNNDVPEDQHALLLLLKKRLLFSCQNPLWTYSALRMGTAQIHGTTNGMVSEFPETEPAITGPAKLPKPMEFSKIPAPAPIFSFRVSARSPTIAT